MSSNKRQNQNMEPVSSWNERNDAHLLSIIEDRLISIKREIRDATRPSERNRLKAKRAEYRDIYTKVKNGDYAGNIILNQFLDAQEASKLARMRQEEMRRKLVKELEKGKKDKKKSKEQARQDKYQQKVEKKEKKDAKFEAKYGEQSKKSGKKAKKEEEQTQAAAEKVTKYVDAFTEVNFDYEGYFRKTRYYGFLAPFVSLILLLAVIGVFLAGIIIPEKQLESLEYTMGIQVGNVISFKLGPDTLDYLVPNDGNWPNGTWLATNEKPQLEIGEKYTTISYEEGVAVTVTPNEVLLYEDLGMTSVYVTTLDVFKAFFYTPIMSRTRVDFIEDMPLIKNKTSWFYVKFMRDRMADITIERQPDGTYDASVIVRWLATYGTIICLMATLVLLVVCLISIIIRFFTYTSRRLHVITFLTLLFAALTEMLPALLMVDGMSFSDWGESFEVLKESYTNYLVLDSEMFLDSVGVVCVGLLPLIALAPLFGMLIVPILFKNRLRLKPSFVPKGNKPHTFLKKDEPKDIAPATAHKPAQPVNAFAPVQLNPALLGGLTPAAAAPQAPPPTAQGGRALSKRDIKKAENKMSR